MKINDGKISVDLLLYGGVKADELTKENVKLAGASVEAVDKVDENRVTLTLSVDDVQTANDFAAFVSDKVITLGDFETAVYLTETTFYPIFDYIEDDGDNLRLTLKLYAGSGTFDKSISAGQISFGNGFANAKVESVELDSESDSVAALIITVPANGQTSEEFNINGTVTISADALVNAWGEKSSRDFSYTRDYTVDL